MRKQSSGTAVEEMYMLKVTGETSAPTMRSKAILVFQKYQSALLKLTIVLLLFAYCFVSWTSLEDASVDESFLHIIRGVRDMVVVEDDITVKEFNVSCTEKSIDGSEDLLCMVSRVICLPFQFIFYINLLKGRYGRVVRATRLWRRRFRVQIRFGQPATEKLLQPSSEWVPFF